MSNSNNRIKREIDPFTMVSNSIINDETISLSAKGMYAFMRSKPDGWNFTIRSMSKQLKEGQGAIGRCLNELKENGWLEYQKNKDGTGEYFIMAKQAIDSQPKHENPNMGLCMLQKTTRINNTDLHINTDLSNINMSGKPDNGPTNDVAKQIIEYLNLKAGTAYMPKAKSNTALVNARIKDGATVEQLHAVIDRKCAEWLGTKMAEYLRPATLFGATKFNQYVGQLNTPLPNKNNGNSGNDNNDPWADAYF